MSLKIYESSIVPHLKLLKFIAYIILAKLCQILCHYVNQKSN